MIIAKLDCQRALVLLNGQYRILDRLPQDAVDDPPDHKFHDC